MQSAGDALVKELEAERAITETAIGDQPGDGAKFVANHWLCHARRTGSDIAGTEARHQARANKLLSDAAIGNHDNDLAEASIGNNALRS
jgi:hypothetical protein